MKFFLTVILFYFSGLNVFANDETLKSIIAQSHGFNRHYQICQKVNTLIDDLIEKEDYKEIERLISDVTQDTSWGPYSYKTLDYNDFLKILTYTASKVSDGTENDVLFLQRIRSITISLKDKRHETKSASSIFRPTSYFKSEYGPYEMIVEGMISRYFDKLKYSYLNLLERLDKYNLISYTAQNCYSQSLASLTKDQCGVDHPLTKRISTLFNKNVLNQGIVTIKDVEVEDSDHSFNLTKIRFVEENDERSIIVTYENQVTYYLIKTPLNNVEFLNKMPFIELEDVTLKNSELYWKKHKLTISLQALIQGKRIVVKNSYEIKADNE